MARALASDFRFTCQTAIGALPHSRGMIFARVVRRAPPKAERAQGMPGVWLHPQPCVRSERAHKRSHYRRSRNIDIPCAMVLTAYIVRAPARPAFVSPSPAHHLHRLSTCHEGARPARLGRPLAHCTSDNALASIASRAPRLVTIGRTPLERGGMR